MPQLNLWVIKRNNIVPYGTEKKGVSYMTLSEFRDQRAAEKAQIDALAPLERELARGAKKESNTAVVVGVATVAALAVLTVIAIKKYQDGKAAAAVDGIIDAVPSADDAIRFCNNL